MAGLLDLRHICTANNIGFAMDVIPGCAFVGHGRNQIANRFMRSEFRDLLFIDADIGFNALDAAKICRAEPSVVMGLYFMKQDKPQYPALFVDPVETHPSDRNLIRMQYGPTGFMRIRREVFEAMMERWPDEWYIDGATKEKTYDFFPGGRNGNNFNSEDIAFCMRARECGISLWAMQGIELLHSGGKTWRSKWQMTRAVIEEGDDALEDVSLGGNVVAAQQTPAQKEASERAQQAVFDNEPHFSLLSVEPEFAVDREAAYRGGGMIRRGND